MSLILTPEAITALRPGPELDRYVHLIVLGLPDEPNHEVPPYSESPAALAVLSIVPIEVGRFASLDPEFTQDRPYFGRFTVGPVGDTQSYMMKTATPEMALCKAALLYKWAMKP